MLSPKSTTKKSTTTIGGGGCGSQTTTTTITTLSCVVIGFLLTTITYSSWKLQALQCEECLEEETNASNPLPCNGMKYECQLFLREYQWSFILMFAHILPFVLLPITMYVVWIRLPLLVKYNRNVNGFTLLLGLASIMIGCGFEFGWHIHQKWYYQDNFHLGNYLFYFFLIGSFILWAHGIGQAGMGNNNENKASNASSCTTISTSITWIDVIHVAFLMIFTILYPIGASLHNNPTYKIPIYIVLTITFTTLSYRGLKTLKTYKMLWVPFFSIVVNLFFIALLKKQQVDTHNNTTTGEETLLLSKWNYIYHAAHDLFGTEMGVAVFAYLVYNMKDNNSKKKKKKKKIISKVEKNGIGTGNNEEGAFVGSVVENDIVHHHHQKTQ